MRTARVRRAASSSWAQQDLNEQNSSEKQPDLSEDERAPETSVDLGEDADPDAGAAAEIVDLRTRRRGE
jgi:hypothetical protein